MNAFKRFYGASPLQLVTLLGCFALSGYAALQISRGPLPVRTAVWFAGAVLLHDLVLFPLYALADRSLTLLFHRGSRRQSLPGNVNYLRVPVLLSGLLFLVFAPVILRHSEGPYHAASGLNQAPFLGRWLALTGILFLGSAIVFAVNIGRRRSTSATSLS